MEWQLVENTKSIPKHYNLYECSNCGFRVAAPKIPDLECWEC